MSRALFRLRLGQDCRRTALFNAAGHGFEAVVQVLIDARADVNKETTVMLEHD